MYQQLCAVLALLLHIIPIGLGWVDFQHERVQASISLTPPLVQVRLDVGQAPSYPAYQEAAFEEGSWKRSGESGHEIAQPLSTSETQPAVYSYASPVYLNPNELDVRPQPSTPVMLSFPDVALEEELVSAVLVLYIDQAGNVNRIEVTDSSLPPAFEQSAVETFMQVKMQPGMKAGRSVSSKMKIAVEFESR